MPSIWFNELKKISSSEREHVAPMGAGVLFFYLE